MNETAILCWSAAGVGTVHTLLGPDHYVPFIAMSRARGWSSKKTLLITVLCGLGHVLGSVVLGIAGVALGMAVFKLEQIESMRGEIAAWMLIGFGLAFFTWGVIRSIRRRPHRHWHSHDGGTVHYHEHHHDASHLHVHANEPAMGGQTSITPWILFTIFLFGPCEPLIPLVMYPAAAGSWWQMLLVTTIFAAATIATMTTVVWLSTKAGGAFRFGVIGRFAEPLAGLIVLACGIAVKFGL